MNLTLRARDFMTSDLFTVGPETEIMTAVKLLVDKNISGLLVLDDEQTLIGILTERDCIAVALQASYFEEYGGHVADFMTGAVETIGPSTSILDIARIFSDTPFRRLPVVENDNVLGLISRRDVLRALINRQ